VKAIAGKDALENESSTGGFIAGSDWTLICQSTEEAAHFHQVRGKLDDFSMLAFVRENCRCDRIGVNIETNICDVIHGWTPYWLLMLFNNILYQSTMMIGRVSRFHTI
jgi:hypothetical protein